MTRRITDDELARRIVEVLRQNRLSGGGDLPGWVVVDLVRIYGGAVSARLEALRDEGRVVEVAGPRGSLWRLP